MASVLSFLEFCSPRAKRYNELVAFYLDQGVELQEARSMAYEDLQQEEQEDMA